MSNKIKVEGYTALVRDLGSNAIVNTNTTEYSAYIKKYKMREKNNDMLRNTVKEINTLKSELFEIKKLLKEVINK
jgi:hypothetical protein